MLKSEKLKLLNRCEMHKKVEEFLTMLRESGRLTGKGYSYAMDCNRIRFIVKRPDGSALTSAAFREDDDLVPLAQRLLHEVQIRERAALRKTALEQMNGMTFRLAIGGFQDVTGASAPIRTRRTVCR